jgi:putative peptidoglycan lipid II flippase
VTTAAGPRLAELAPQGYAATGAFLAQVLRLQLHWLLPAALGLAVMAEPVVRAIYQTGRFDEASVARTVLVTRLFALALVPVAVNRQLVRVFHAHRDQRTPMRVTLAAVAINLAVGVGLVLLTPLSEAGLALATGVSAAAGCAAYLLVLHRRGAGTVLDLRALARPAFGALFMVLAVASLLRLWPQPAGAQVFLPAVLRLLAAAALGAGVYIALAGLGRERARR